MQIVAIELSNYKSVEYERIEFASIEDGSFTFGIIGENETGKSSLVRGVSLVDNLKSIKVLPTDFNDKEKPISISLVYKLDNDEQSSLLDKVKKYLSDIEISELELIDLNYSISIQNCNIIQQTVNFRIDFSSKSIVLNQQNELKIFFDNFRHQTLFWSFDEKYLISKEIDLIAFLKNPESSIPLKNCFKLAGYNETELSKIESLLLDSTEREYLADKLSDSVTKHIRRVWKKHKVKITFNITQQHINLHIKDENSKGRAKTTQQRSDGFKQFLSFLLTVSAENANKTMKNKILLIDEPEVHLHPKAQEDLLEELIDITKTNNNILFYTTHSNYLIDKKYLNRNIKAEKVLDSTKITWFDNSNSTYSSINYEVFGISSLDYHNELYDKLRENYGVAIKVDDLNIKRFDDEYFKQHKKLSPSHENKGVKNSVTLPTFIRNCIHYPELKNKSFNDDLIKSIELLKSYLI